MFGSANILFRIQPNNFKQKIFLMAATYKKFHQNSNSDVGIKFTRSIKIRLKILPGKWQRRLHFHVQFNTLKNGETLNRCQRTQIDNNTMSMLTAAIKHS